MPLRLFFALLVLASIGTAQTADELVARNLSARGGADRLRAIQTMTMTGTIGFGGPANPLRVKVRRPNQIREDFVLDGAAIVRAYDGARGWESKAGQARQLVAGELDNIREEAENAIEGPLLDYAKKGSRAEAIGKADFNGKPAYKLRITTSMGTTITQFLDATSYLEVHEEIERSVNGKPMLIVEDISDYRDVSGIKFAHRFVSGSRENPAAATLQIDKMELNAPLDAAVFGTPSK